LTPEARDLLATEGYNPQYGARPLRQTVQQLVEDPLCEGLLSAKFKAGDTILIDRAGDEIELQVKEQASVEEGSPLQALPRRTD